MKILIPELVKLKIYQCVNCQYAVILTYHSVISEPLEFDIWTHMQVSLFEKHMAIVSSVANVIPVNQLVEQVVKNNIKKNLVAVTFDDGFRNNFTKAYPILKKYGVPATIFLATDYIDSNKLFWPERVSYQLMRTKKKTFKSNLSNELPIITSKQKRVAYRQTVDMLKTLPISGLFNEIKNIEAQLEAMPSMNDPLFQELMPLSWEEIKVMENEGLVSFGGHSASHTILSMLGENEAYSEMKDCKKTLDKHLNEDTKIWAYPNGSKVDFSSVHEKQLYDLGFNSGILTMEPEFISGKSNINELGRFGVGSRMSDYELRRILSKRNRISQYNGMQKIFQIAMGAWNYLF